MSNRLYDSDLQLWIEQTIKQLQNREFASLDIEHLIEELVDLGKSIICPFRIEEILNEDFYGL
ncbi:MULTISPECIES: DUF29 family protein [unclassified Anabaena]|uniref:DUF29 family protein n=1 Tax=unclassified Anabaena TaxID=2619674 RepID=UPI001447B06F|nr:MULTISPECIES: DUF29 family protein [unclassified Anabaena]MTJ08524.1 DUF29 domain-containing protein [Anabaena sp. UHCC 0204]MTJ53774.1 DUF29 domain-containing protein [Anabaena sp. UHCC 0253]